MKLWQKGIVAGVWCVYMFIMGLITFPNHYNFRTYFYDLGFSLGLIELHTHNPYLLLKNEKMFGFSTALHSSPSVYLAVPFYLIGGVWGVLFSQWLAVGITAIGMFLYAYHRTGLWHVALLTMIHFLGMWGLYALFAFDWHEVAMGMPFFPFFLLLLEKERFLPAALCWLPFIGAKETYALWGIWLLLCFLLIYKGERKKIRFLVLMSVVTLVWIVVGSFIYMGGLSPSSSRAHLYTYLGDTDPLAVLQQRKPAPPYSTTAILYTLLTRPQLIWTLLFESPIPEGIGIKTETYWAFLWSGGWMAFRYPLILIAFAPVFLYKQLAADLQLWGILFQYSTEFALALPIFFLQAILRWKNTQYFWPIFIINIISSHGITYEMLVHPYSKWSLPETRIFWKTTHYYSRTYNYAKIHEGLKLIPREARVSACSNLVPHIPPRFGYYLFPHVGDAEYIALLRNNIEMGWPVNFHQMEKKIVELSKDPNWEKIYDKDYLVIFRRKKP